MKPKFRLSKGSFAIVRRLGIRCVAAWVAFALPAGAVTAADLTPTAPTLAKSSPPGGRATPDDGARLDSDLYILGPGDQLRLVFLDPSAAAFGSSFPILNDGTATLSLLGTVQLSGLTIGQANRWLTSLYSKQLLRPNLYLNLTLTRPTSVTVLGEVQTPGLYQLRVRGETSNVSEAPGGSPGLPTVISAIQKAGGITLNADVRQVTLRRLLPGTSGAQKQINLNLAELLQFGNQLQNPLLFDGDTIIVGKAEQQLPQEIMELGASNLTPQTITVNIVGEVKSPGRVSIPANSPLSLAILSAGGPNNWRANKGRIELVRIQRNGSAVRTSFALDYSKGVVAGVNPPLKNNDTLIVHRSLYGEALDVLNQVVVPITNAAAFWNIFNRN
jgi:polysaccharide export outer membrane protein